MNLPELGIPTMEEYIDTYCRQRGLSPVTDMTVYIGYAQFRYAAMVQGIRIACVIQPRAVT